MLPKTLNFIRSQNLLHQTLLRFATTTIIQNQYNFYVDFKGLLYFDDGTPFLYPNCIKDAKFITYFYKNLKPSTLKSDYPYQAQFWGEKNYLRYAIAPIVFNNIDHEGKLRFSVQQKCDFYPQKLRLDSEGRIWHPYRDQIEGIFSNDLIANFLQQVQTKQDKSFLHYRGNKYEISKK